MTVPRPLHEEGGIPAERSFTTADIQYACRCAARQNFATADREAEFLIEFAMAVGRTLEQTAKDCLMTDQAYKYLLQECKGDYKATRGLERMKQFRKKVARLVMQEAYNRKKKKNVHHPKPFTV